MKRTVTDRETPEEKEAKKQRGEGTPSYSGALSGLKVAVVQATYPEGRMTPKDAEKVHSLLTKEIDKMELPAPRFEGSRWMGEYQGFICVNEATFSFLKKAVETTGEFKVYKAKDLPPRVKVMALFPKKEEEKVVFRRLEYQNDLSTLKWKILKSWVDEKGYQMVLAIDTETKEKLEKLQWKPFYLAARTQFRLLEEKDNSKENDQNEPQDGSTSSASEPPAL